MDDLMALVLILLIPCLILVYRKGAGKGTGIGGGYTTNHILDAGTYRIGVHLPPGTGDLEAIDGKGELIVKRWGVDKYTKKFTLYASASDGPDRCRNLTLHRFDTLQLTASLKIVIKPPTTFPKTGPYHLVQGFYRFGKDIPPATYNLKVASGNGTVRYFDPNSEEASFTMEMGGDGQGKVYNNLPCAKKGRMTIEGTLKLELTKSKKQSIISMQKILNFLTQNP